LTPGGALRQVALAAMPLTAPTRLPAKSAVVR
jgi:hypothetical protein